MIRMILRQECPAAYAVGLAVSHFVVVIVVAAAVIDWLLRAVRVVSPTIASPTASPRPMTTTTRRLPTPLGAFRRSRGPTIQS